MKKHKPEELEQIETLKNENKRLKKTVSILRKRLNKFKEREEDLTLVEDTGDRLAVPINFRCPKCKGEQIGKLELFNKTYFVCKECSYRHVSERKS